MGFLDVFKNHARTKRAGDIAVKKNKLERLRSGARVDSDFAKSEDKLVRDIARKEEAQKIASENNTKTKQIDKSKHLKIENNVVKFEKGKKKK